MKKFTTLDEDLLKESQSAQDMFNLRIKEFEQKMNDIKLAVYNMKEDYQSNLRNWGYAGSMGYINEQLDNILQHLEQYVEKQPIPDPNNDIQ
ncbi:hypothetical protein M0Q97_12205 [Candidatus Dojkabacteria bacterium]|jgi:hypothetical protein|nr:hypothetical protein [Candidatus Dojkabacteria bacterium]